MVLIFTQMLFQKVAEHIKGILAFFICHSLDQRSGKGVIGYLLKIINEGIFIAVTIQSEPHKSVKGFDKTMGVFRHVWYRSFPVKGWVAPKRN